MKFEISVSEIGQILKEIQSPGKLFDMIRLDVRQLTADFLNQLMANELTHFLGRERYQRQSATELSNHRNGSYKRNFAIKGIGPVDVKVPRDRHGRFKIAVLPAGKRYEEELARDMSLMFLSGISTRSLSMLSCRLIGRRISTSELSSTTKQLNEAVEKWRNRDLSTTRIKYIFVDGVNFAMRISGRVDLTPVLVSIGVTQDGHKLVLGLQAGDKESATGWRQFFKDLKARGLDGSSVVLGIMDGLAGLETVFKQEFPAARVQRCQVHVSRNVLAKVVRKHKEEVADDLRSIFYAPDREKVLEFADLFRAKWARELPSAVSCFDRSIDSCLTFFNYPEDEWISLRTTNIIERLNKEFKRRTRPMEIVVAGEAACYRLLAFICLKMELHWRSNPIGKVRKNLPFYKKLDSEIFTQES